MALSSKNMFVNGEDGLVDGGFLALVSVNEYGPVAERTVVSWALRALPVRKQLTGPKLVTGEHPVKVGVISAGNVIWK